MMDLHSISPRMFLLELWMNLWVKTRLKRIFLVHEFGKSVDRGLEIRQTTIYIYVE